MDENTAKLGSLTLLLSIQALLENDNVEKARDILAEVIELARKG